MYAVEPHAAKGLNTSEANIAEDMVFSDGSQDQMAALTGAPTPATSQPCWWELPSNGQVRASIWTDPGIRPRTRSHPVS
jgi:hypothetical protein